MGQLHRSLRVEVFKLAVLGWHQSLGDVLADGIAAVPDRLTGNRGAAANDHVESAVSTS
ncbi:hypothetical protein ACVIHI_008969 [Bradyrhizobium sp. USDA 4524]|uniref:hypothetical protein n=1 Tax=unclassified Bradyrhizobium TaxID=2631580 RepID=UPI00209D6054|nr:MULTISPECIES: hypothetical protein [unclassified Bradyrhizobium]MCP1845564.1 hypothetical protein [Bradyrhizobium sp. USDA 4538]MCP1907114.1 hypothetical protein [Bradyrhizobium sp. USDA 4537]MCP1985589.1 hypothetical protein [Bradyrhizobium sp. USDA 4539]